MGESTEGGEKAQMGFVEAYECMTIKANATQGNSVRRASWPPRLFLVVEEEDYMDDTLDPAFRPEHSDRLRKRDVLILCLLPPDEQGSECPLISNPWCPSHDDLIATDWERDAR